MVVFKKVFEQIRNGYRFRKWLAAKHGEIVACTNVNCKEWIRADAPTQTDVRKRWIIKQYVGDEHDNAIISLCPKCVKEFFGLKERDYLAIERGEQLTGGMISPSEFFEEIVRG